MTQLPIVATKLFSQGTPGFRAHASKIFNVFSCVIDALDKDPDLKGIKKIIAEGLWKLMILSASRPNCRHF